MRASARAESIQQALGTPYCQTIGSSEFCDDFEDGNATANPAWTIREQAVASDFTVIADGGNFVYRQGNTSTSSTRRISSAGTGWANATVEGKLKVLSFNGNTANWAGIYARYNTAAGTGYILSVRGDGKVYIRKKTGSGTAGDCLTATWPNTSCGQTVTPPIAANTWYSLKLVLNGNTLTGYVNGTKAIEVVDSNQPYLTAGAIGVGSTGGTTFTVDDVTVNRMAGPCANADGTFKPAGTECRASAGECDQAETCTGSSADCPTNLLAPATKVCRAKVSLCDVEELCTGASTQCPTDAYLQATQICNPSSGACDPAEACTGTSPTCPQDVTQGPPAAPSGLVATPEDSKVALTWIPSAQATGYKVKRATSSNGAYVQMATVASPPYSDEGLENGTPYFYRVSALGSCGESSDSGEVSATPANVSNQSITIVMPFPKGVSRDSVAIAANGSLRLNDRAKVYWTNGAPASVSNAGEGNTNLGVDSIAGSVTSVAPVILRDRAQVFGDLTTASVLYLQNETIVTGNINTHATLTPFETFSWTIQSPTSTSGAVTLQPDAIRALEPGAYDSVVVNSRATLRLSPGVYHMASLTVEPDGILALNKTAGPIVLYVAGSVIWRGVIQDEGGPEGDFLLVCLGTQGVILDRVLTGTIVAPNTKITFSTRPTDYRGTYYAKEIEVHQGSRIIAVPFDWTRPYGNCAQFGCGTPGTCHKAGVCNPFSGTCSFPAMEDGVGCVDGNACTQTDMCIAGTCVGANPKVCTALDACHTVGTCDPDSGSCSNPVKDKVGCNVFLRVDGVIDIGGGQYIAVFGYNSSSKNEVGPVNNGLTVNNVAQPIGDPKPPLFLSPGSHPGVFLPKFSAGQKITWTVDGESVFADQSLTKLPLTTLSKGGSGVEIEGKPIVITPDFSYFEKKPEEPTKETYNDGRPYKGVMQGSLSVGPTGASVYTVPVPIPPGIAGMAPNLNLVYNSQGSNSLLGQGWDITGFSSISRCQRNKSNDGYVANFNWRDVYSESGDAVCLDGARLYYRGNVDGEIRYELENSDHSQISWQSGGHFKIVLRSGETRYYGSREDARVVGTVQVADGDPKRTLIWLLDRVEDPWGNFYEINYNDGAKDFLTRGILPRTIKYTGHRNALTGNDEEPFNTITLAYEERSDKRISNLGQFAIPRNYRLTRIDSSLGGRYTQVRYKDTELGLPSRVKDITHCQDANNCLQPLEFEWEDSGFGWVEAPELKMPVANSGPGTQFVDLDGDGRLDFVLAKEGFPKQVWRNLGKSTQTSGTPTASSSWELRPDWVLPGGIFLAIENPQDHPELGRLSGTQFADINGDGQPDLISDWYYEGTIPNRIQQRWLTVYINKLRENQGWVYEAAYSGKNSFDELNKGWSTCSKFDAQFDLSDYFGSKRPTRLADMNGDGYVDVMVWQVLCNRIIVLLNKGEAKGWQYEPRYQTELQGFTNCDFRITDRNRDGLPDLPGLLNLGNGANPVTGSRWATAYELFSREGPERYLDPDYNAYRSNSADFNGDGLLDMMAPEMWGTPSWSISGWYWPPAGDGKYKDNCYNIENFVSHKPGVDYMWLSTWDGWTMEGAYTFYTSLEQQLDPPMSAYDYFLGTLGRGRYGIVDLNSDGLADAVTTDYMSEKGVSYLQNRARMLINTGSEFQKIPNVYAPYAVSGPTLTTYCPAYKDDKCTYATRYGDALFDAYIDLNGDGMPDHIQTVHLSIQNNQMNNYVTKTFLNTFKSPVIRAFPNGFAQKTKVEYESISSAEGQGGEAVYYESGKTSLADNTVLFVHPLKVVKKVISDNGLQAGTNTTKYRYQDLRKNKTTGASVGFKKVVTIDQAGFWTETKYMTNRPFVGSIESVSKKKDDKVISERFSTYYPVAAQDYGPGKSYFIRLQNSTDKGYVYGDPGTLKGTVSTEISYEWDNAGNATKTVTKVTSTSTVAGETGESYSTETVSTFGTSGSREEWAGKPTSTTVTSKKLSPVDANGNPSRVRTTKFEYQQSGAYPLIKKIQEPGSGIGTELHTSYAYDEYGNLVTTTSCASDFNNCSPGATGPSDVLSGENPPFRTARISYDPADFNLAPAGIVGKISSLPYGKGRFPVKTQNSEGYTSYSAYDQNLGMLLQSTGPDGVHTCFIYDYFGRKLEDIERCGMGIDKELKTTYFKEIAFSYNNDFSIRSVTKGPTGNETWIFSDRLGRTRYSATRLMNGRMSWVTQEYDALGRNFRTSQPYYLKELEKYWTTTRYDSLGRVADVTQALGVLTGVVGENAVEDSATKTLKYEGFSITSTQLGQDGERKTVEKKNGIGKVVETEDEKGGKLVFKYDADGNLTDAIDPKGNTIHTDYDLLGRKVKTKDPDLGEWSYVYNGFGELITQTDAKGRQVSMRYDRLGRLVRKTDAEGASVWGYIASGNGIGRLDYAIAAPNAKAPGTCPVPNGPSGLDLSNRPAKWFSYNALGEMTQATECVAGESFLTTYVYDKFGRQEKVDYPAVESEILSVKYNYTSTGHLHYVSDATTDKVYWVAKNVNEAGRLISEHTRNGVETERRLNGSLGWMLGSTVTSYALSNRKIQDWMFNYNRLGNLLRRVNVIQGEMGRLDESFTYDDLDRLTSSTTMTNGQVSQAETYAYDALGNITQKGSNTYEYTGCTVAGGPHAVCKISGQNPFSYDGNGNLIEGMGRNIVYNSQNKATRIQAGVGADLISAEYVYGVDGNRIIQIALGQGKTETTTYIGLGSTGKGLYERTQSGSTTEHKQFIYAGGYHGDSAFAVRITKKDTSASTKETKTWYQHFDHLGSITAQTDEVGKVGGLAVGNQSNLLGYDSWGSRRGVDGKTAAPGTIAKSEGSREFTGQEAIPGLGLVNMNGRIYDPALGRFISPDPNVQGIKDLQSYNRYSYVRNNPLRYTDPTGYFWFDGFDTFVNIGLMVASATVCAGSGGAGCGAAFMLAGVLYNTASAINDGASFQQVVVQAAVGAAAGYAFGASPGAGLGATMAGGALASMATYSVMSLANNRNPLGEDLLKAGAQGAFMAGLAYVVNNPNALSEASQDEQQQQGDRDEVYGKGTGRKGNSRGVVAAGVREYDLSGMSEDEVRAWERKLRVSRPEGRGAVTMRTIDMETTVEPTAKGLKVTSATASVEHSIVYWESPSSESGAGDGTLRDHEYGHVKAGNAAVERFNQSWKPKTINVPGGDIGAAQAAYEDLQVRALRIRLRTIDDAIDRY